MKYELNLLEYDLRHFKDNQRIAFSLTLLKEHYR
jgi:hypothetical protein